MEISRYIACLLVFTLFLYCLGFYTNWNFDEQYVEIPSDFHIFSFTLRIEYDEDLNTFSNIERMILSCIEQHKCESKIKIIFDSCSLCQFKLVHLNPIYIDRSCLIPPTYPAVRTRDQYFGPVDIEKILQYINFQSHSYLEMDGNLSAVGNFLWHAKHNQFVISSKKKQMLCDRISLEDILRNSSLFIHNYWIKQRPVVIDKITSTKGKKGVERDMLAILSQFLNLQVGVKLSPSREFEGVESLSNWDQDIDQVIPSEVLAQLQSPELVVVRPVHQEMSLAEVLDLISLSSAARNNTSEPLVNAYVEYLKLTNSFSFLKQAVLADFAPFLSLLDSLPFLAGEPHLWLGDGRSVGKLHFDPYDNVLLQLEGSKSFLLADAARNEDLKEGHMREAQLERDHASGRWRVRPLESTSMVHSPQRPTPSRSLRCEVHQGEALFLPSYFWHEVASTPGPPMAFPRSGPLEYIQMNVAVNFWYPPLFSKEFPCATCRKEFNTEYLPKIEELLLERRDGRLE